MTKRILLILLLCASGMYAMLEPEPVPRKTVRTLDQASYHFLAGQWREYIKQEGESARALTNLARAFRYDGQADAARKAAEMAVDLDPDYAPALDELGNLLSQDSTTIGRALKLLEHCRKVMPDYEPGLNMLAVTYMKLGKLGKADEVFKEIYDRNLIPEPLQDYGLNMLVGLPEGAVLFTNGDNDTFPALVIQAGAGFRKDVAVINRYLIRVESYRRALFKRYPGISFDKMPEKEKFSLSDPIIRKFVDDAKAPMYFAQTLLRLFDPPSVTEGFNDRIIGTGGEIPVDESARLFLDKYRLDSATDSSFPWMLYPSIQLMMLNYPLAMLKIAERDGLGPELKEKLLDKAQRMVEFHDSNEIALKDITNDIAKAVREMKDK